ncbi:alpha/beta fold hydrolase [Arthrobacter sp. zg-Y1110]|nr:alpha/beta fold hydrolase [Arthrobacter sp. zg-Y1110]UWX86100.1 alpha/beta hydrolase [Arthrobacter sp. zg-Y1110]
MEILFVHGAGGYQDDLPLAEELHTRLGLPVTTPRFPDADMSAAGWRSEIERHRNTLAPDLVIVGHSFGASMALLHLADEFQGTPPLGLVLLAMPFWGSEGWQAEYTLPADAKLPTGFPVWLHHCVDDEVVPIDHLDRHAARLPQAQVRRHTSGGHQFEGRMAAVAGDVGTLAG